MSKNSLKKFLAGGRNSRQTASPQLGAKDPRIRGGMQRQRSGDDLGDGIDLDRDGRATVQLDPRGPLRMGPNGVTVDSAAIAGAAATTNVFNTSTTTGGGGGGGVGPAGPPGPPGPPGPDGAPGLPGVDGEEGEPGAPGPPGADGAPGATGMQGPPGIAGMDGDDGDAGPPGPTGATGATGPQGLQGAQGLSGMDGDDGEQGPPGVPGPTGATGATGMQGPPGMDGSPGEDGVDGAPGPQGPQGVQGIAGFPGQDGDDADFFGAFPLAPAGPAGGDLTGFYPNPSVANNAVTYAKMQDVSATSRIIGRKTAGAGDPEECTLSEVLDFISSAAQGDILYRGAATWARLGAGTASQVLQTGGAAANPAWGSANKLKAVTVISNAAATYTVPAGVTALIVEIIGAGGGGGGASKTASQSSAGGGGGSGAYCRAFIASPAASYAYDIKAGGTGGNTSGTNGTAGATSTFGSSFLTVPGGGGGTGSVASASPQAVIGGAGATAATGGDVNTAGNPGMHGFTISITLGIGGNGAPSPLCGGAGRAPVSEGIGASASNYGGGGGGAVCTGGTAKSGGGGGNGVCIIYELGY